MHKQSTNFVARFWGRFQGTFANGLKRFVKSIYRPTLHFATEYRYVALAAFIVMLILVGSLLPSGKLRFVFFPDIFRDNISANLELEEGLPIAHLHENSLMLAEAIRQVNEDIQRETGQSVVKHIQISSRTKTKASVSACLISSGEREIDTGQIVNLWRNKAGKISAAKAFPFSGQAGPANQGLSVQLASKDLFALQEAAEAMKENSPSIRGL